MSDACTGDACRTLNFNVGVLGHVDSGKTSLAKALSSTASTAAFDKNPQSRERGITLDLGFSSFTVDLPDHLREESGCRDYDNLQFTLVDCPGHASLIRTIIGGAQIIDLMLLVVDVVKGLQTQTAECLLIGEFTCPRMVVILNKTDLLAPEKRQAAIDKMTKRMHKTLESTRFKDAPVIAVAAKPGGPEAAEAEQPQGISTLIELLKSQTYLPRRDPSGPLLMAVDHCFSIRGQGTVMTGTVLQGALSLNDMVEIPALKVTDDYTVIGRNLFKKETNLQLFMGLKVALSTGEAGIIEGGFGQSGKFKIRVPGEGLCAGTKQLLSSSKKKAKGGSKTEPSKEDEASHSQPVSICLTFKRYVFDPHKKMIQS
uniref:Eukaryotic elongation factor, selenocysteine-tRNA-specific n=1 Tax=Paramormyrops kingsleyae TaxID=1676925 RepID=A0A3B3RQB0_9TELE